MSALSDTRNSIAPAGNALIQDSPEGAAVRLEDSSVAALVPCAVNSILEAVAFQNRFVGFRSTFLVIFDFSKVEHVCSGYHSAFLGDLPLDGS